VGGLVAAAMIGAACYPYDVTSTSQLDVVATAHDSSKNFSAVQTYLLLDSVVHVIIDSANFIEPSRQFDALIVDKVEENLQALGWTGVRYNEGDPLPPTVPDVALLIAVTASNTTSVYYNWWPSWGWYPGWGWGCVTCYPGYGYPTVVSYDNGTLAMNMIETISPAPNDTIPVVWVGALRGLLGTSASTTQSRITNGINQAFNQSPYLKGN
jgi:hypothetical protein